MGVWLSPMGDYTRFSCVDNSRASDLRHPGGFYPSTTVSLHINCLEGYKWNIVRHVITKSEVRLEIPLYKSKYRVHMTMFIVLVSNANNLPKKTTTKNHQKKTPPKNPRQICWSFGSWRLSKEIFVCFVFDQIQN